MQGDSELYPLVNYDKKWFILGVFLAFLVVTWVVGILWATRRRKQSTLSSLTPLVPKTVNIPALKSKYLKLIDDVEAGFRSKQYTARYSHQRLSILLRFFVFEASGFPAHVMTVSDLKISRYPKLGQLIDEYYPPEFAAIEAQDVDTALLSARTAVQTWQ
jgi:hypothetical protein